MKVTSTSVLLSVLLIALGISCVAAGAAGGVATVDNECTPRTVRLLLGDRYGSPYTSPYTATLQYQTYGECTTSGLLVFPREIEFSARESVHSVWDSRFCHNKKTNCEQVQYDQYVHTIRIAAVPTLEFSYILCGDINNSIDCTQAYTSKMPLPSYMPQGGYKAAGNDTDPNSNEQYSIPMKVLFFGDHDNSKAGMVTFDSLYNTLSKESFDAFLFLGDYGYEFYQENGKVGDDYISNLTPINTAAPMAITAGNHEDNFNFEFFNQKFQMMHFNETKNNYYSFEIGKVHFLSLNLHYYNNQTKQVQSPENQAAMLSWVEKDLKSVDRKRTPWVIVFGHKMIYCKGSDCDDFANDYAAFDELLNKYNVDLFISGHKHKFQVMKPVRKMKPADYMLSNANVMSGFKGFPTIIQGNGGTSKADEDVEPKTPVFLGEHAFVQSKLKSSATPPITTEKLFDKTAQKKAMLYEVECIGFGKLTIYNDHMIKIESVNSVTNEVFYSISFFK